MWMATFLHEFQPVKAAQSNLQHTDRFAASDLHDNLSPTENSCPTSCCPNCATKTPNCWVSWVNQEIELHCLRTQLKVLESGRDSLVFTFLLDNPGSLPLIIESLSPLTSALSTSTWLF